jgi:hypothetical protein
VGLNSLKSLNLTNVYPNNKKNNKKKKNNNNKVKSKPLELYELAELTGKKTRELSTTHLIYLWALEKVTHEFYDTLYVIKSCAIL